MVSMPIAPAASAMGFTRRASPALWALAIGVHGAVLGSWDAGAHAGMDRGGLYSLLLQSRICELVVGPAGEKAMFIDPMRLGEGVGSPENG